MKGRLALVTGAGRGIGRQIALDLSKEGAHVALVARTASELEEVSRKISSAGGKALACPGDLTADGTIDRLVGQIRRTLGPVEILVNNAGMAQGAKLLETDLKLWEDHMRLNVTVPFLLCRAVLAEMIQRKWGRIINIASIAALVGQKYTSAYTASKHGLLGLTRSLALEVIEHNITVNAICPGWVDTPMTQKSIEKICQKTGRTREEARKALEEMNPQGRLIQPEEVSQVALRLARDDAGGITGQDITVDG